MHARLGNGRPAAHGLRSDGFVQGARDFRSGTHKAFERGQTAGFRRFRPTALWSECAHRPHGDGGSEHEPAKQHANVRARLREGPGRFDETAPILAYR